MRFAYRWYRPWEQAMLRQARAIIATSAAYRDSSAALAYWQEKTQVIPLGLGASSCLLLNQKPPVEQSGKSLQILAVGRLTYYKGFDVLLRALVNVPEAHLLFVGSGEQENYLRALAETLGVSPHVTFAGNLPDDELAEAYAQSDMFCLPSIERSEAFGLVLLEAMRAKLPIVASAVPGSGVGFVVQHEMTGLLVPPGDSSALAAALQRFIQHPLLRESFGLAGYSRWQQYFTLEKVTEQTLALYQQILRQNPHSAATKPVK